MSETIKDYLHLYLGCEVETVDGVGINLGQFYPDVWTRNGNVEPNGINIFFPKLNKVYVMNYGQCRLILRPFTDITEEEKREANDEPTTIFEAAEQVKYLLSKHLDLFGLIEKGLAIDATTISKQKIK